MTGTVELVNAFSLHFRTSTSDRKPSPQMLQNSQRNQLKMESEWSAYGFIPIISGYKLKIDAKLHTENEKCLTWKQRGKESFD